MAGASLFALLDDIASLLDDVSVLTKVAAKKTAGVLGDDLALNAQQVTGVNANRELPVVWAVAKGSLVNKVILVPAALAISALEAWLHSRGWNVPWYSSYGSDFNYDFHATFDASVAPIMHNYRTAAELEQAGASVQNDGPSESQGISVFFRLDDAVYHTYSSFARGVEGLTDDYSLLDITPYGRQEDWEDSPSGWPQRPTYG